MEELIKTTKKDALLIRIALILFIAAVGAYVFNVAWSFLSQFNDVIIIFFFAWLLSFILEPIVEGISNRTKVSRVWSTALTYLLVFALLTIFIVLFIPIFVYQLQTLQTKLPYFLNTTSPLTIRLIKNLSLFLDNLVSYIPSAVAFFFYTFLVLLFAFYFNVYKERIIQEITLLTPKKWRQNLHLFQTVISDTFSSFIRIQLIFAILSGISTWIVLVLFHIDFALSSAFFSGIFTLVPAVGPFLALIPPMLVALIAGDPLKALLVFILLLATQQVIYNIYGAKLLGKTFRLHPIIVLVSFVLGYKIAGGLGSVFAVPILGITLTIIKKLGYHFVNSKDQ